MKILALLVLGVAALLCRGPASAQAAAMPRPGVAASAPPNLTVDAALWVLETTASHEAVLTFDHHPSAVEVVALEAAGLAAQPYRALPMVVVHGTGAQLRGLLGLPGLRSIFLNRGLEDSQNYGERRALLAAASGVDGWRLIRVDTGAPTSVVTVLEGFDWVFRNRLQHGIQAIANGWGTGDDVSPDDPINVATKIAHDAGLTTAERLGP